MFLFKPRAAYEMRISDWSSDVGSSDLTAGNDGSCGFLDAGSGCRVSLRQAVAWPETPGFHVAPTALQEEYLSLNGRTTARGICHTGARHGRRIGGGDRGRLRRSEEHTSELQSLMRNPYAVLCLTKKHIQ